MIKVGITGQSGFMGTHLFNYLGIQEGIVRIPFEDPFFDQENKLKDFVQQCDVIVHLAAMNRHGDPQVIYDTNIRLVKQLIEACDATKSKPHILFSSSTQEEHDNPYGKSKKEGREMFEKWADKNDAQFTGLIIPNVFGPFGHPYYNSVVATFCYQLTHNETPKIDVDGVVKLIYVGEVVERIWEKIKDKSKKIKDKRGKIKGERGKIKDKRKKIKEEGGKLIESIKVPFTSEVRVSGVLKLLESYKKNYFEKGIIPDLNDTFEKNLFNTFLCYIDHKSFFPFFLIRHSDERGLFVETMRLKSGGQVSFSITKPGITRGNHFHTRKAERFAVIKGKARIELRRIGTDEVLGFELDGEKPSFVDMPIWHTHNISNIGDEDLYTIFWINEFYDPNDSDTYFEKVQIIEHR